MAHLSGIDAAGTRLGSQALQVPNGLQNVPQIVPQTDFLRQSVHRQVACVDGIKLGQRRNKCAAQRPPTHWGACPVQHVHQRRSAGMVGMHNFKVPNREAVEPHAVVRPQAPDAFKVGQFFVVCGVEVVQNGARRDSGVRRVVQAKPLERSTGELLCDAVRGMGFGEHPVVEFGPWDVVSKQGAHISFTLPVDEPFLGFQTAKNPVHPAGISFCGLEFTGAQIQQGEPHGLGGPMDGGDEVVCFAFEHVVVHDQTGGDELGHPAFDQSLGLLRVFQLIAHGHLQARLDKFGEVGVETVVGKSGELHLGGAAVAPFGQHDVQDLGGGHGIAAKGLVEIAHPEKQDSVRMLRLDPVVLFHQRGFLSCHCAEISRWIWVVRNLESTS